MLPIDGPKYNSFIGSYETSTRYSYTIINVPPCDTNPLFKPTLSDCDFYTNFIPYETVAVNKIKGEIIYYGKTSSEIRSLFTSLYLHSHTFVV